MQDICEDIRTAIEHGRTDIIRSLLGACTYTNTKPITSLFTITNQFYHCFIDNVSKIIHTRM